MTIAGVVVGIGACERRAEPYREPPSTTAPAPVEARGGGPSTSVESALSNMAEARCDREARCNNIGTGRRHTTRAACLSAERARHADDINRSECRGGVDHRELNECLSEIRSDNCGNPLDTLERLAACRTSDLCQRF